VAGLSRASIRRRRFIKQARRYKSRRDLTRAIRLVAKADLPCDRIREQTHGAGTAGDGLEDEPKLEVPGWMQEQLPV